MSNETQRVTIVIVNWNVRDLLRACLASVYSHGGLPPEAMKVIVVDNASADGSVEMVRAEFPQVLLIDNKDNVGFGKANNQTLPLCNSPYMLLLNPDTVVEPGADVQTRAQDGRSRFTALAYPAAD